MNRCGLLGCDAFRIYVRFIESLFSLGEVGSGVTLGFDDYSLVSLAVLK